MSIKNLIRHFLNRKYENEQKIYFVGISIVIWLVITYATIRAFSSDGSPVHNAQISLDLNSAATFRLESDTELARGHNGNCSYWDCFNVYRCGENLSIYVYPLVDYVDESANGKSTLSVMSREFFEILKIIVESRFYTSDPNEACILIPSIDTLNLKRISRGTVAKALATLPHWENGENHLIFNAIPSDDSIVNLNTDRAMIAGADFDVWSYRTGFDFVIPFIGFNEHLAFSEATKFQRRPIWLTASVNKMTENVRNSLLDAATKSEYNILLLDKCHHISAIKRSSMYGVRCEYETSNFYDYRSTFAQSEFCLIAKTERLFQINFIEALAAHCIPVICADNIVLPFTEILDWSLATISIRESELPSIDAKLKSISSDRKDEMRNQLKWLYETYFSSNKKIISTALEELNDRIFTYRARTYIDWNAANAKTFQNPLFLSRIAQKSQGFTAVILTYDRVESLFKLIEKLSIVPSLQKILVIWNNDKEMPPHPSLFPKINKPLKVIRTKANKLSNRFFPYEEIETEAILTIDDDIVMLTADELDFGFEVWREFPDRIVGFPSRVHIWENETMRWRYESEWTNQISMVLTGAAFHHKYWSYAYTNEMPAEIREWVDDHMNCEDIAMNFLVANFTKKPPIKVAPRKKFKCPECTHTEMLSADINHMLERSACIDRFAKIYGVMPLKTVEFRADPVLFKDNFPEKLKRFNDVGSL